MTQIGILGAHVEGFSEGYSRDIAMRVIQRIGGTYTVVLNDWQLCRDVLANGGIPVYRINRKPFLDDDADHHFDPVEYVNLAHAELTEAERFLPANSARGIIHVGNELGSTDAVNKNQWMLKAVKHATGLKRKVVAFNWSVQNPDPGIHPTLAPSYQAIRENGGWVGWHEGTTAKFPTVDDAITGGAIGGFIRWQLQYGFQSMITEFAASLTPHDGWAAWISRQMFAAIAEQSAERVYAPHHVSFHPFTVFRWSVGRDFEYVNALELQDDFGRTSRKYPVKETPMPEIEAPTSGGVLSALTKLPGAWINVRTLPSASAADVGDLMANDVVNVFTSAAPAADGWVYIVPVNAPSALAGWVSLQGGAVVFTPALLQPTGVTLTPGQAAALRGHLKAAGEAVANAENVLDEAEGASPDSGEGF